jgi:hypothetical protein
LVYIQSGMPEEAEDEVRSPAEASKATINTCAEVADACRGGIAQVLFDVAMAALLGIHIWRIGREPCHVNVWMRGHIVLDDDRSVCVEPIPDDDHRPGDVLLEVAQGDKNICGTNGMVNMTLINLTGQRQGHHRGPLPTFAHTPEDRRVPPRRPSRAGLGAT